MFELEASVRCFLKVLLSALVVDAVGVRVEGEGDTLFLRTDKNDNNIVVGRDAEILRHTGILPGTPGNHNPSFRRGPDIVTIEDVGTYDFGRPWATEVCDGEGQVIHDPMLGMTAPYASRCPSSNIQTTTFTIDCDRKDLFANGRDPQLTPCSTATCNCDPTVPVGNTGCAGALTFTTADDACGTTLCSVFVRDGGNAQCVEEINQQSCQCNGCCQGLNCDPANTMAAMCPGPNSQVPFLCPSGCEPADCSVSITHYFSITVECVNDAPSFECMGSAATSGARAVTKGDTTQQVVDFLFNIDKCANCAVDNEEGQGLRFVVGNNNQGLFQVQPRIAWDPNDPTTADLLFDPKPCEVGTATISVRMFDDGGTANGGSDLAPQDCDFQIEIKDTNTPPTYDLGHCPIIIDEDAGAYSLDAFATRFTRGCVTGSGEESQQTLTFNTPLVDTRDQGLFAVQPNIDVLTGRLSFEARPDINTYGKIVEMYVQLCDDGLLKNNVIGTPMCTCDPITNCPKCAIEIRPKNDLPSFVAGPDVLVQEDLCDENVPPVPLTKVIPNWATSISVGSNYEGLVVVNDPNVFNPEGQTVYFVVTSTDDSIFAAGGTPSIDETGTLTFTLEPDANGVTDVLVTIRDTGTAPNTGNTAKFRITALAVNDPPTFDLDVKGNPGPLDVLENSGPQEFDSWLSRISKGPDDEMNQVLTLRTFVQNPTCFKILPQHQMTSTTSARLSFEPASAVSGGVPCVSDVTVYVKDDGLDLRCNALGGCTCGDETEVTYTIRVLDTNDKPSFTKGPNIAIAEDQFPGGFTQVGWATQISAGLNEGPPAPQTVLFVTTTNNDALFAAGSLPSVDPTTGALRFTAAQDACGTAEVSVYAEDNGVPPLASDAQTFTITISCCNDPPEFTLGPDLIGTAVLECRQTSECPRQFPNFVTGIRPGPASAVDEVSQRVSFFLEGFDTNLFEGAAGQPKINEFGTLSFTTKVGVNTPTPFAVTVRAQDDGKVQAGCVSTAAKTFQLQITPYNDAPSFVHNGNVQVLEDTLGDFPSWARNIIAGPADEVGQTLTFTVSAADRNLFSVQPDVNEMTGRLTFTPAPDAFGRTEVTVTLDDGQAVNSQYTQTILITIVAVNDKPSFTAPAEISILEDSPSYLQQYAASISKGAANEASQTMRYAITGMTNTDLFTTIPSITSDGVMSFLLKKDAYGDSTFVVTAVDDGGLEHGGVDTSDSVTTVIRVTSVNDPPTFKVGGDITGVLEDSGAFARANYITSITSGADNEASQLVTFALTPDKPELFFEQPRVDNFGTLSFTPAPDAFGSTTVSIAGSDTGPGTGDGNGGGPPDQRTSDFVFVTIQILPVNDAPTFLMNAPVVVTEDPAAPIAVPDWATQVSVGAANEAATQQLTWRIIPVDTTLFSSQPVLVQQGMSQCSGACTADLQFTPAADANGATDAEVCLTDNGGILNGGVDKSCQTTTITITPVDDPPVVTLASTDVVVLEDSGTTRRDNWLQNVVPGPRDELNQLITSVTVAAAPNNEVIFQQVLANSAQVERFPTGPLVFTSLADQNGVINLNVVATDSGSAGLNTAEVPFTITVQPVNDAPSFTGGGDVSNIQNTGAFSQRWATAISAGPANEATQALTFDLTVGDASLFSVQPRIDASSGVLTFEPGSDRIGKTAARAVLRDNGGTSNGGVDTSAEVVFDITVFPKNNQPLWFKGPDVTVLEDSGSYSQTWASNISAGGITDIGQKLTFVTSATPTDVLVNAPSIDVNGVLTFVPQTNRYGVVTVRATLQDDGGILNGGISSSLEQTFTITVLPVNDPPVFTPGPDVVVLEDAPPQVVGQWIRSVIAGSFEDQSVTFFTTVTARPELFSQIPTISSVTSELTFTPAVNANGEATVRVVAKDSGGTANGGRDESDPYIFRIRISPVNDAPLFTPGTNIAVTEDDPASTVGMWASSIAPAPASATDEFTQTLTFSLSNNNPGLFQQPPQLSASGDLTFQLAPNANGIAEVSAALQDSGGNANGGVPTSPTSTFTITVTPVDDPPFFTPGTSVVNVEPSFSYNQLWATGIAGGPPDENQNVRFTVTNDNPGLFTTQPTMTSAGTLEFTASSAGIGGATVSVVAFDAGNNPSTTQTLQIVVDTAATAVRTLVSSTQTASQFNGAAFSERVCALLGVPSDRCVTTLVVDSNGALEVQVDFQPRVATRASEPTANELAKRFLLLSTTSQVTELGVSNARPVPSIGVDTPDTGCSSFKTVETCVTPCFWDSALGICTDTAATNDSDSGLSLLAIMMIILACLAVVLAMAALTYYCLRKRKERQERAKQRDDRSETYTGSDLSYPHTKFAGAPESAVLSGQEVDQQNPLTKLYGEPRAPPSQQVPAGLDGGYPDVIAGSPTYG